MSAAVIPWRHLRRITVSTFFYEAVFKHFPILKEHTPYRNFFWYLCFGAYFDRESKRLLLCREMLADFAGKPLPNFCAEEFLWRFSNDVIPLAWTDSWSPGHRCRQLTKLKLGNFQEILSNEYQHLWRERGRVYPNGEKFSAAKAQQITSNDKSAAEGLPGECAEARFIQKYLNNLPPHLFSRNVEKNYRCAVQYAFKELKGAELHRELRILKQIESQPQPFYSATSNGNSVRLFANESIPNLRSDVRKVFTQDWFEADLRCSQLGICAWLWDVTPLETFLQAGNNFWNHLCDYLDIPAEGIKAVKPVLKAAVYSLCYGMEEHHIRGYLTTEFKKFGIPEKSFEFITEPHLNLMLEAREREIVRITTAGGDKTCYDKPLSVRGDFHARHILAQLAQAWEMKIIFPAFRLAAEYPDDFKIMLYQFDGFSVHFTRRPEQWRKRIKFIVDEQAKQLGVSTWLEWDESNPLQSEFAFAHCA
jgi:hypothetical protein